MESVRNSCARFLSNAWGSLSSLSESGSLPCGFSRMMPAFSTARTTANANTLAQASTIHSQFVACGVLVKLCSPSGVRRYFDCFRQTVNELLKLRLISINYQIGKLLIMIKKIIDAQKKDYCLEYPRPYALNKNPKIQLKYVTATCYAMVSLML